MGDNINWGIVNETLPMSHKWSWANSLFFSATVITTIGKYKERHCTMERRGGVGIWEVGLRWRLAKREEIDEQKENVFQI